VPLAPFASAGVSFVAVHIVAGAGTVVVVVAVVVVAVGGNPVAADDTALVAVEHIVVVEAVAGILVVGGLVGVGGSGTFLVGAEPFAEAFGTVVG
jgi:hypothetical protein